MECLPIHKLCDKGKLSAFEYQLLAHLVGVDVSLKSIDKNLYEAHRYFLGLTYLRHSALEVRNVATVLSKIKECICEK